MKKKRVLNCSELFYPSKGGVQQHTLLISQFLKKNNFDVEIATSKIQNRKSKFYDGIKINEFNISGSMVYGYSGNVADYQNFLINKKFDIIMFYAAQQWTFDLAIPILDEINAKKIFLTSGFPKLNNVIYYPYYKYFLKSEINKFDKIVLFSKANLDFKFCNENFYKKKNIVYINNGGFVKKNKKKHKKNSTIFKILNVANFGLLKNQVYLIFLSFFFKRRTTITFIYSKKNLYFLVCLIISKLVTFFKRKINFDFIENPSQNEILNFYYKNDLFVFTSLKECAPLVIIDCILNNLFFISLDVGNVKNLSLKHKFGKIVRKPYEFIKFINNFQNKNFKSINKKEINWKYILPKYLKLYKDL